MVLPTLEEGSKIVKAIKELSATAIMGTALLLILWHLMVEVRPVLNILPAVSAGSTEHAKESREFYQEQLTYMRSLILLSQVQCRAYMNSIKRDATLCEVRLPGAP